MNSPSADPETLNARWLRDMAANVDYAQFRKLLLHPVTEEGERGFVAACYERMAQRANSEGEYYLAYDAASLGLQTASRHLLPPHKLVSAKVTALARSGATETAQNLLDEFLSTHEPDSSLCSAQARLLRDRGLNAPAPEKGKLLSGAADWAARAKDLASEEGGDWAYPANQEAQFRFLAGDGDAAMDCAREVIDFVSRRADDDSMWDHTNLAEMHLVCGELEQAEIHYRRAAALGASALGDLAANRAVAFLLLDELGRSRSVEEGLLDQWFLKPVFVVFAGHIPDAQERSTRRLPEAACRSGGEAARAIKAIIQNLNAVEGISAGAPGGDILFAEEIIAAGAQFTLVETFSPERVRTVAEAHGHDWPERLARVGAEATRRESIAGADEADEAAQCEYANHVMLGLAMLRAKRVNGTLHALVLWDESDRAEPRRGGTGEFVALCQKAGVPVEVINPNQF